MRATVRRRTRVVGVALAAAALMTGGCTLGTPTTPKVAGSAAEPASATLHAGHHHPSAYASISRHDRIRAQLATAAHQDVASAEAAGWASSLRTLGCFQDPRRGGMGLHYINGALMDDKVDISRPEALVYELDAKGHVDGLVAHEYIVPIDAWHGKRLPRLFGVEFHQHPTLPLYVLHAWLWKDNARGDFDDWNPAVRQCPAGVPVFGEDLPRKPTARPTP